MRHCKASQILGAIAESLAKSIAITLALNQFPALLYARDYRLVRPFLNTIVPIFRHRIASETEKKTLRNKQKLT